MAERENINKLELNISKTKCLMNFNPQLSLSLGGKTTEQVKKTKVLGC